MWATRASGEGRSSAGPPNPESMLPRPSSGTCIQGGSPTCGSPARVCGGRRQGRIEDAAGTLNQCCAVLYSVPDPSRTQPHIAGHIEDGQRQTAPASKLSVTDRLGDGSSSRPRGFLAPVPSQEQVSAAYQTGRSAQPPGKPLTSPATLQHVRVHDAPGGRQHGKSSIQRHTRG